LKEEEVKDDVEMVQVQEVQTPSPPGEEDDSTMTGRTNNRSINTLVDLNMNIERGTLTAIVGSVGSG
jgi:ABC-type bacteriocin/lantibiotic exporter with double-glycine peptidase domain